MHYLVHTNKTPRWLSQSVLVVGNHNDELLQTTPPRYRKRVLLHHGPHTTFEMVFCDLFTNTGSSEEMDHEEIEIHG